jgi:hypothetical protein
MTQYKPMQMKVGDRRPYLEVQLLRTDGKPLDLTGADLVFTMRQKGQPEKIDEEAMVVTSAAKGLAEYHWGVDDTDTAGIFQGEVTIIWPGGVRETQPDEGYIIVQVNPRA